MSNDLVSYTLCLNVGDTSVGTQIPAGDTMLQEHSLVNDILGSPRKTTTDRPRYAVVSTVKKI